ncbi:MAG: tRNA 2-selenouridine(34) synthase MnmH [Lachnospirales bacterium]
MRVEKYKDIIEKYPNAIFVDLRTELEYEENTIPGAINIPILSNEERAEVGTIYKQRSKELAIEKAIIYTSEKLPDIFIKLRNIAKDSKLLVVFCARGGMRSSSVASLFSSLHFNIVKLDMGYKGYRHHINKYLPIELEKVKFIGLYGKTGTGKTKILKELKLMNIDILDLEGCANHRGSTLGSVGLSKQNSQKTFESLVYDSLIKRNSNTIFIEGESKRIGNVILPSYLYEKLINSTKILIESSIDYRTKTIHDEYINEYFTKKDFMVKLNWLNKYISKKDIEDLITHLKNNDYDYVIKKLMINYYDIKYNVNSYSYERIFYNTNDKKCGEDILKFFNIDI